MNVYKVNWHVVGEGTLRTDQVEAKSGEDIPQILAITHRVRGAVSVDKLDIIVSRGPKRIYLVED